MGTAGFFKDGSTYAGLAWFIIDPAIGKVENEGYACLDYPQAFQLFR